MTTNIESQVRDWKDLRKVAREIRMAENKTEAKTLRQEFRYKLKIYSLIYQTKFNYFERPR